MLISGPSGIGKSELCLALIDRGAQLVSDDHVLLEFDGHTETLRAHPAPNIAGQIEIRNLGIQRIQHVRNIPVTLLVTLEKNAPRFIDNAAMEIIAGLKIPHIAMDAHSAALPIKAEWALRAYGLQL